jgi:hypothetical protein
MCAISYNGESGKLSCRFFFAVRSAAIRPSQFYSNEKLAAVNSFCAQQFFMRAPAKGAAIL